MWENSAKPSFPAQADYNINNHKVLANIPLMSRPRPATSVRLLVKSQAVRQHPYDPPLGRLFFYGLSTLLSIKTLSYLNGLQDHLAVHS